jgi:hypothetical protein
MNTNDVIATLRSEKDNLRAKFGVEEIGVFGSYARNEQTADSDVDILIRFRKPSFHSLMGAYLYLEKVLGRKVDLVTRHKGLSSRFLKIVEREVVYA